MRNIVILNLSDLHCQNRHPGQIEIFRKFKKGLKDFIQENPLWQPDFIVVPGDIVNGKDNAADKKAAYQQVQKWITDICLICNLQNEHVIVTCGNHDKDCSLLKDLIREKEDAKKYIGIFHELDNKTTSKKTAIPLKTNKNNESKAEAEKIQKLREYFPLSFNMYSHFISPYVKGGTKSNGKFIPLDFLEKPFKYLTGYKVFEELKIVFLILNSEWITVRGAGVDPGVMAGHRMIIRLTDEIRRKYPFHTIIGVMHRAPYELDWEEKNTEKNSQLNPYQRLLNTLDIMISGHEHAISLTDSPSYFHNQIQHFQLGSFAISPDGEDFFPNSTSLIKLDTISNEAELVIAKLDTTKTFFEWKFEHSPYIFPIPGRFGKLHTHNKEENIFIKNYTQYQGIEIIHTKWSDSDIDLSYIHRCILNRFYPGDVAPKHIKEGEYTLINGNRVRIEKFNTNAAYLDIQSSPSVHLIVYSTQKEECQELSLQQLRFQTSIHLINHIFTPILLQKI